jgi:UDP-N-acetylglucosamine 2-epimerase (hydrolysing)
MSKKLDIAKKIVFLTGTRADYGKLKSLISKVEGDKIFEVTIFVTGMHMLEKFGHTHIEIEKSGFKGIFKFVNQNSRDDMDQILAKTINGFGDYVKEFKPDLIIIHGDRVETLAGAIVGSLNNILTAHIEGGEVSGTIDEMIRHAVTKLSHIHFCSTNRAKKRLIQLGETNRSIYVIGSPDIDAMKSENLPALSVVKKHYGISFNKYSILLFHPVTTDTENIEHQTRVLCESIIKSKLNYIVIYPNNDNGSELILKEYRMLFKGDRYVIIPSMRFEYFLRLLKSSDFIIGNSSAGIVEATHFGIPTINLGNRQHNRGSSKLIDSIPIEHQRIEKAIEQALLRKRSKQPQKQGFSYGDGNSAKKFYDVLCGNVVWKVSCQKYFVDSG